MNLNASSPSMPEVHASVTTGQPTLLRRMFAFAGPAYLVSVGYMDPGNWATDLEGGARFGYRLLWVLVISNLMAILLQTLSARLGIVTGRDLAQACRESYPKPVSYALWVLCEIAIAACDLAEVLGAAIALQLLFGLPLLAGVLLSATDALLVLWMGRFGMRAVEFIILSFITMIGGAFMLELFLAKPDYHQVALGLIPWIDGKSLYVAIGILGATVMPHNLYLHSSLVQTRQIGLGSAAKRSACRFNLVDSVVALNGAMVVNAAILILAGALFFQRGIIVTEIQQAHQLLAPLLGTAAASVVFAIALLCSGQSSTITGTMAGQIVMEGFLNFRVKPWLRRFLTRMLAVAPAAFVIYFAGERSTYKLIILSQVILSLQLPFAVIPLVQFTSDRGRMGEFANAAWVRILSWAAAGLILGLNIWLAFQVIGDWLEGAGAWRPVLELTLIPLLGAIGLLLAYIVFEPSIRRWMRLRPEKPASLIPEPPGEIVVPAQYRSILVTLDHTRLDTVALRHASALAKTYGARLHLLHVEEGVVSQIYGELASTAEVEQGRQYFDKLLESLHAGGVEADFEVVYAKSAPAEIIACAKRLRPDLVVMGAHGHRGLKDVVYGATINHVRHAVGTPVLIVQEPGPHK
jgi:manganese transport protein